MSQATPQSAPQTGPGVMQQALVYLAFAILGLVGAMVGALIPALRVLYRLDFRDALAAQWVALVVSGVLSLPVLVVLRRLGAVRTICAALAVMAAGCLMLVLAVGTAPFALVLGALAVIAMGSTVLQVAGNPLAAAMGAPERRHFHLALAQAFNALGVLAGVNLGSAVILGRNSVAAGLAGGVAQAYAINGGITLVACALFAMNLRHFGQVRPVDRPAALRQALASRWAWAGAVAIALYVGAEGAIGSVLINFLHQPDVLNLPLAAAGHALANVYWGGALAGRFIGSWLLIRYPAPRLLGVAAAGAATLCLIVVTTTGSVAGFAALAIGVCNAIMFPTIFSLTLARSSAPEAAVSGLLCTALAGGALVSIVVGAVADRFGIGHAFVVPLLAYVVITVFAGGEALPIRPRMNRE